MDQEVTMVNRHNNKYGSFDYLSKPVSDNIKKNNYNIGRTKYLL